MTLGNRLIAACLLLILANFVSADDSNRFGLYQGNIDFSPGAESKTGIIYEHKTSEKVGFMFNHDQYKYKDRENRAHTMAAIHYYPVGGLQLGAGIGIETSNDGTSGGIRLSLGYVFEIGSVAITPIFRQYGNASETGIAVQLIF
ncbi:hypothetical protein [Pleionea sediminis]|uniref:hypothetical protein n=1 Tax=Pleionea sediminis TaxID=2569479 RepID=UPI00118544F0|nr:hypothetical protein [Pleionea sediminis]